VDELLGALAQETDLSLLAGMVVGANPRVTPAEWVRQVAAAFDRHVPEAGYPVLVNADICHMTPSWTLPYGETAVLDSERGLILPRTAVDR
jgi:muramoyltetrapeptide carboxypeptidase LdcA involved in peptidoglycan recycling